jgi:hypothetical protein
MFLNLIQKEKLTVYYCSEFVYLYAKVNGRVFYCFCFSLFSTLITCKHINGSFVCCYFILVFTVHINIR